MLSLEKTPSSLHGSLPVPKKDLHKGGRVQIVTGQEESFKIEEERFRLDVRKKGAEALAQGSCGSPILEVSKARLQGA